MSRTPGRLANRDGLDAATLASLAADRGVRPPSLYNHMSFARLLEMYIGGLLTSRRSRE